MLDAAKIRVCSVVDTHVPIGLLVMIAPCRSGWLRSQSTLVGPDARWLDGALGVSNSSAPFRNRIETLDTAGPSPSYKQAKVPDAVLPKSPSEARPENTESRTHLCGHRNEAV